MFNLFSLKDKGISSKNDDDLMRLVQKGDHAAFTELVHRHSSKCYSIAYRFAGNICAAEDVVQVAFLKIWQKPELWNPTTNKKISSWIYRIIINICLDNCKKKLPEGGYNFDKIASHNKPCDEQLVLKEKQQWIEDAITNLPENQQIALNLYFYEGFSNKDAAEIMNLSVKAVQSLIMRGKHNLKKNLKDIYGWKK